MPNLRSDASAGHRQDEVVGELVEGPLDAEVGVEGEREHDRVRRHVAAGVVADEQHRPLVGDVAQAADLAAVPEAGEQPHQRQVLADVVGVALVEVGARDPPLRPGWPTPRRAGSAASRRRSRCASGLASSAEWPLRLASRRNSSEPSPSVLRRASALAATRGRRCRQRSRRLGAGEEVAQQLVGLLGRSTCGTWPQSWSRHLLGARQPLRDVACERPGRAGRGCPRRTAPAARARPAADRSRGGRTAPPGRCCGPRPGTRTGRPAEW